MELQSKLGTENQLIIMNINDYVENINTKDDFVKFLLMLRDDFNRNKPEWENRTLEHFLDALYGFAKSLEGYYQNSGEKVDLANPNWKVVADLLLGATIYE